MSTSVDNLNLYVTNAKSKHGNWKGNLLRVSVVYQNDVRGILKPTSLNDSLLILIYQCFVSFMENSLFWHFDRTIPTPILRNKRIEVIIYTQILYTTSQFISCNYISFQSFRKLAITNHIYNLQRTLRQKY